MTGELWNYQAKVATVDETEKMDITDGDTFYLVADTGFRGRQYIEARLKGVDTAEIHGVSHDSDEYELGMRQKEFVRDWFWVAGVDHEGSWPLKIRSAKELGSFNRWLVDVERKCDGRSLAESILELWPDYEYEG